ncbi:MAG: ADP-ribosylglycohydrolase family protein [Verrucomicrobiota bacterium]
MPRTILILEDNEDRIRGFESAVDALGTDYALEVWRDAPAMIRECRAFFAETALISLDHDLNPAPGSKQDPGTGLDVVQHLCRSPQFCPVILHTSNVERVWSMHNDFRFAGWTAEMVSPYRDDWISVSWFPKAQELLSESRQYARPAHRPDHAERCARARLSLTGLSVGDGFGECFFCSEETFQRRMEYRSEPPPPWFVTDDTIMALSVVQLLEDWGDVEPDALARRFAEKYRLDPRRGYGSTAHGILQMIGDGISWRDAAASAFDGMGSMGNGGAMRAAPIGAFFSDDVAQVIEQARRSAMVTHKHHDGQAGAIAIAVAAAWATNRRLSNSNTPGRELLAFCHRHTPPGDTRNGIAKAYDLPLDATPPFVARVLGNGSGVISSDTVPFTLWSAARHLDNYADALWTTVSALGDRDTTCAIVGGIVAMSAGLDSIPPDWIAFRGALPFDG